MIFNPTFKTVLSVCMSLSLFSCSDFLKGKPAQQENYEIKVEQLDCLKDVSPQIKKLMSSELSAVEVSETFQCLDQTLNQFQSRVNGKSVANQFTAEEMYIIFEKFHKEAQISKAAVIDLIVLKKALLGGSDVVITKTEIGELRTYLNVLKGEVQKLLPHIKIFRFEKEKGPFSKEMIETAFLQLRTSLKVLLSASQLEKSSYEFEDFKKLIFALQLVQNDQVKIVDIAEKIVALFFGNEPLNGAKEYEQAINNITELMIFCSDLLYNELRIGIEDELQVKRMVDSVDRFVAILLQSVQFKKNSQIEISAIDDLIEVVNKKLHIDNSDIEGQDKWLLLVKSDTFKSFYKKIFVKVFSDKKNVSIDGLDAIKKVHLKSVQKELTIFKLYLNFISSNNFDQVPRQKIDILQARLKKYSEYKSSPLLTPFTKEEQQYIIAGFEDFKAEFLSTRPILFRDQKMVIALNQNTWDMSWQEMTRTLYGKMLGRELLRGWGNSEVITEAGLIDWYSDFKEFAVEIKAFDPRSKSSVTGAETFLHANLFSYSGNGDQQMSKIEAFQYVNMLMTGGSQMLTEMRAGLKNASCELSIRDEFDYLWIDEACFYSDFRQNYKKYFSNLSYLTGYLDKLSDHDFKHYYDALMVVARRDSQVKGRIETADLRTLSMTLMYIESLYAIYDADQNWLLSASEIRNSFPRFNQFVTDYANKNAKPELDEWNQFLNPCRSLFPLPAFIKESFVFMAYNGRLPKKIDVNDPKSVANAYECGKNLVGVSSSYAPFKFAGEIDRKSIINTFKVLKSAIESK